MSEKKSLALFSGIAMFLFVSLIIMAGYKQGWLEPTVQLHAHFDNADGLREGTAVVFHGIRVGSVKTIELDDSGKVLLRLSVLKKYIEKLNSSVIARSGRTFVIGDKIITLAVSTQNAPALETDKVIPGEESIELVDLLSGGRLSPYFNTFSKLLEQIQLVIEGGNDSVKLIELYQQAYRALKSVELLGEDVRTLRKDVFATTETKALLSQLAKATKNMEAVMSGLEKSIPHIGTAAEGMSKMVPELTSTLKETQFTFQALQKSFILRGGVRELKEEQQEKTRLPASSN
jgi:ABC-type transporter Mla subunit MlaD